MVRNVSNIKFVPFMSGYNATNAAQTYKSGVTTPEISNTTPDFGIKLPQKYTKIGEETLSNGLKIHSYKLSNGYKVTIVPMKDSPAVVKNYVNVGSMNETDDIKGISHFLEHMAFNGTIGDNGYEKLKCGDSFKKIDNLGGWTNASTSYAVTDYVNSTPLLDDKDVEEQIRIIAAMTENLALNEDMIEKEKSPVSSEINMILDNPETIAIDQTLRTLFNIKSSADELVGGSTKHITNLTKEKVKEYYDKYYTPDNMNLVITGDVEPDKIINVVAKEFHSTKQSTGKKYEEKLIPIENTVRKDFISEKATSAEIALGFEGPAYNDTKSKIVLEIIDKYLDSEEAGLSKILKDYNTSSYFENDKIISNPYSPSFNLYYLNCDDKQSESVLKAVFDKLSSLNAPSQKCLNSIKEGLKMDYKDSLEYSINVNSLLGRTTLSNNTDYITKYEEILKSITSNDVAEAINKYLNVNRAALTVIHPQVCENEIIERYNDAKNLSFKGNVRTPVNTKNIQQKTLQNNYRVAFCETGNDNISYGLVLNFDKPENLNPAAIDTLDIMFGEGINNISESDYNKYNQENNLSQAITIDQNNLVLSGHSGYQKANLNIKKGIELLNNPKLNQFEFEKAKNKLRESLLRTADSSESVYDNYEAKNNSLIISKDDILRGLDTLTLNDVKALYYYIMNNSSGIVVMNTPKNADEFKQTVMKELEKLDTVKSYEYKFGGKYKENEETKVLTKARKVSQADIKQTFKFQIQDEINELTALNIMNTILSSSNSIGLFNSLREKDHLAYTVKSTFEKCEDCGYLSLKILTTTDNKEKGEISYDNLEKSINGFNRQIGLLLSSKYTDEDLESAKKILKAKLLDKEGTGAKIASVINSLSHKENIDYDNISYKIIDSITREDIDNIAQKVFSNKPVYAIVASSDTLNANKEFLEALKN